MTAQLAIEIVAAAFGMAGTLLLATRTRWAGYGFVCFLFSNLGWLAFSWANAHVFMFVQQLAFTVTSLVGIWCWIVAPAINRRFDALMESFR